MTDNTGLRQELEEYKALAFSYKERLGEIEGRFRALEQHLGQLESRNNKLVEQNDILIKGLCSLLEFSLAED